MRDRLNGWSETLHRQIGQSGRTPYHVMGRVLQRHAENVRPLSEPLDAPGGWDAEQLSVAEYSVGRAAAAIKKLGIAPVAHPWRGATGDALTPFDADRLREAIAAAAQHIAELSAGFDTLRQFGASADFRLRDVPAVASGLRHLARMPIEGRATLTHPAWRSNRDRISSLHDCGRHWTDRREELGKQISEVAWRMELEPIRRTIAVFWQIHFPCSERRIPSRYRRAEQLLPIISTQDIQRAHATS
jgi:hypothetical protein